MNDKTQLKDKNFTVLNMYFKLYTICKIDIYKSKYFNSTLQCIYNLNKDILYSKNFIQINHKFSNNACNNNFIYDKLNLSVLKVLKTQSLLNLHKYYYNDNIIIANKQSNFDKDFIAILNENASLCSNDILTKIKYESHKNHSLNNNWKFKEINALITVILESCIYDKTLKKIIDINTKNIINSIDEIKNKQDKTIETNINSYTFINYLFKVLFTFSIFIGKLLTFIKLININKADKVYIHEFCNIINFYIEETIYSYKSKNKNINTQLLIVNLYKCNPNIHVFINLINDINKKMLFVKNEIFINSILLSYIDVIVKIVNI